MAATMKPSQALRSIPAKQTINTASRPAAVLQQRWHYASSHRRRLHSSSPNDVAVSLSPADGLPAQPRSASTTTTNSPLSRLPLSQILRSYLITTMSSSPALLGGSTNLLRTMLESKNPLFNLDKNPLMRAVLMETFYKQFCAGADKEEVGQVCAGLRQQGYSGVILEYALEVLKDAENGDEAESIAIWKKNMLCSVDVAAPGDFLGLKWSGLGPAAMKRMAKEHPPSTEMSAAMHAVAKAAAAKDIALLPAAEETWNLNGFHNWSLDMQREYNTSGKAVVYTTHQMYLKDMPLRMAEHLAMAKAEGFTLGAKLVRGAYLASEKRSLIHDTIEDTHAAYDAGSEAMIHRRYNDFLRPTIPGAESFPNLNVVIASHNTATVEGAQALRRAQHSRGEELTPLVFAQLQGMADEVSCELLYGARETEVKEKVFKCTTWGTMFECLNYLLRRAAENKDAAGRTGETRVAMGKELGRRLRASAGLV